MGSLVDQSSTVICAHGAQAMATAPNPRVKVGGNATVLHCVMSSTPERGSEPSLPLSSDYLVHQGGKAECNRH